MRSLAERGRFPALDGLRGFAATMVFLCHFGPSPTEHVSRWLVALAWVDSLGWAGVDLFFVLSGFLITGILSEHRKSRNYFSAFYAHRALRIFPLYFLLLGLVLVALPWWFPGYYGPFTVLGYAWPYWVFAANLPWVGMLYSRVLSVTWTLSVEEQFYVGWAVLVRFVRRSWLPGIVASFLIGCIGLRFYLLPLSPQTSVEVSSKVYRFAHIDGLCIGAILRMLYDDPRWHTAAIRFRRSAPLWAVLLLATVIVDSHLAPSLSVPARPIMLRIGLTLWSLFFAALMIGGVSHAGRVQRFFDLPIMRRVGVYSYFIYLFHIPISETVAWLLQHAHVRLGIVGLLALQFAAVLAAAHISYVAIERPFLSLKRFFGYDTRVLPIEREAVLDHPR